MSHKPELAPDPGSRRPQSLGAACYVSGQKRKNVGAGIYQVARRSCAYEIEGCADATLCA